MNKLEWAEEIEVILKKDIIKLEQQWETRVMGEDDV